MSKPKASGWLLWVLGAVAVLVVAAGVTTAVVVLNRVAEPPAPAAGFRDDPRARRVLTETKAEAYERFKKLFADKPELVELTTPDVLPAVVPVAGTDPEAWANELRQRLPEATKVDVLDPAAAAAQLKTTTTPCPPEGER
ncbi:permease-like cell division protein FtsX [Amycolatopsis azurea]|uniref:permease-like cell division protein FtsX n=1 Tax=Amycolatopsis azurea TaxID=36819 RepID=UPI003807C038